VCKGNDIDTGASYPIDARIIGTLTPIPKSVVYIKAPELDGLARIVEITRIPFPASTPE